MSSPLPWGMGDAYDVCGASMCPWDMGGGVWSPLGSFLEPSQHLQYSDVVRSRLHMYSVGGSIWYIPAVAGWYGQAIAFSGVTAGLNRSVCPRDGLKGLVVPCAYTMHRGICRLNVI